LKKWRLSKSRFVAGWQCHKQLWWRVHEPKAPELIPDESLQAVFDRGSRVGEVAREHAPGGVLIDFSYYQMDKKVRATEEAIRNGASPIYEASFFADDIFVAVDILERTGEGWHLIEVKSTTSAKPEHIPDVAIQVHTLQRAGLNVNRAYLMHLNRECYYPDLSNLFSRTDLSPEVERLLASIGKEVRQQKAMLSGRLPEIEVGPFCTDPYQCPFYNRCWPQQPEHHISTLYRIRKQDVWDLEERGVNTILDLPSDYHLSAPAERQRRSARAGAMIVEPGLEGALAEIDRPVAYLDFETIMPAIPVWPGCRPYDQIPVQFSWHEQKEGGELVHHEWLATGPDDPREGLARELLSICSSAKTVCAYNAAFEKRCLQELKAALPGLADPLEALLDKLHDLLPLVRDYVYHPDFRGSFSLKTVLPALVPELTYEGMAVADGQTASMLLETMLLFPETLARHEPEGIRTALLRYCEMDTLAMVRLLKKLQDLGDV